MAESSTGDDGDDDEELKYGESDLDEVEEDDVQNSEASVEEIIDISSSSEKPEYQSDPESSDDDSSDDNDDGKDSSIAGTITMNRGRSEVAVGAAGHADNPSAGGVANANYADFYSDTVPDVIMEQQNPDPETDEPASSEAQVSTTTSSAESNAEGGEPETTPPAERQSPDCGTNKHQAQDLTVPQEDAVVEEEHRERTPEPSSSSSARDLSVVGNERQDQPMQDAEIKLISPSREESFKTKADEKFLGKPKNAHEVDIPAMNLSVKPDEAHGANRKNSKSDESDDSAALNLSTGQLAEPLRVDEPLSGSEQAEEEPVPAAVEPERKITDSVDPLEGPSSRVTTSPEQQPPLWDIVSKQLAKTSSLESNTPATPRRSRRLSVDSGDASTSTPRSNIKTRRMSAMEKIEETEATPSKRATRASSVVPQDTASPPSTPLIKAKRHSSMNNLQASTPDTATLTPSRRSTRASSLAKELLTSTPTRRRRLSETFHAETVEPVHASPSKANDSFSTQDDARSEISNVSVSSRRSLRRKPASVQPAISEEDAPNPSSPPKAQEESFAEYTTKRRLTRHQSAVIEKSLEIVRKIGTIAEDAENVPLADPSQDSESESVVSNASNSSKRSRTSQKGKVSATRGKAKPPVTGRARSTRSTASSRKEGGSDAESIETESPSRKLTLETISEETGESFS